VAPGCTGGKAKHSAAPANATDSGGPTFDFGLRRSRCDSRWYHRDDAKQKSVMESQFTMFCNDVNVPQTQLFSALVNLISRLSRYERLDPMPCVDV